MKMGERFVKVLLIDDGQKAENAILKLLLTDQKIRLVGSVGSCEEGINLALRLQPDLIIMKVGRMMIKALQTIEAIMKRQPTPIMIVAEGNDIRLANEAVRCGALEVFAKEKLFFDHGSGFLHRIRILAGVKVIRHISGALSECRRQKRPDEKRQSHAIAIAASLGGGAIIEMILSRLKADFLLPIIVAQHISEGFAQELAQWLDQRTELAVRVAVDGEPLSPGSVLIAPPEYDVRIAANGIVELRPSLRGGIYHPCCDSLLASLAEVYRKGAIGVILTGMGEDGVSGIAAIKAAGGLTIAQNEDTSLIYNMPRLAIERGLADIVAPAEEIASVLQRAVCTC